MKTIDRIVAELRDHQFGWASEYDVQEGIATVLNRAGIAHVREVRIGPHDRVDFLTTDGIGIEVKCEGSLPALTRQVFRYLGYGVVQGLVVAVTRSKLARLPDTLRAKPLRVAHIRGAMG